MPFALTSDVAVSTHFNSTPSTSTAGTIPTVNAGDFIRVWVSIGDDPATNSITVSDPVNGTYTKKLGVFDVTDGQGCQQFYVNNAQAGTNIVVTASYSSATFVGLYAESWQGVDTVVGFDKEAGQVVPTPGTGADLITSGTALTTKADLILGAGQDISSASSTTMAAGTGFTTNTNGNQMVAMQARFESFQQSAAGSKAATFTDGTHGGTDRYIVLMMAVLPLVVPTGVCPGEDDGDSFQFTQVA